MTVDQARMQHAVLILAAITAEANQRRLSDEEFRGYVKELTGSLDLARAAA